MRTLNQVKMFIDRFYLQAIECILANVTPLEGENGFSDHALAELEEVTVDKVGEERMILRSARFNLDIDSLGPSVFK